ncbi:hypothetical protein, partial [Nocardioides sp. YIM 152588]|uniref:hypothetical protein n=1 Tax=Nocardioides sp. YIM 152588 TaxID=3158259 RepID=UPI0032E38BBE
RDGLVGARVQRGDAEHGPRGVVGGHGAKPAARDGQSANRNGRSRRRGGGQGGGQGGARTGGAGRSN